MKLFVLRPNEINAHILFGNCNALSHKSFATRMKLGINLLHFAAPPTRNHWSSRKSSRWLNECAAGRVSEGMVVVCAQEALLDECHLEMSLVASDVACCMA